MSFVLLLIIPPTSTTYPDLTRSYRAYVVFPDFFINFWRGLDLSLRNLYVHICILTDLFTGFKDKKL